MCLSVPGACIQGEDQVPSCPHAQGYCQSLSPQTPRPWGQAGAIFTRLPPSVWCPGIGHSAYLSLQQLCRQVRIVLPLQWVSGEPLG